MYAVKRLPLPLVAAVLLTLAGLAGLVRGVSPQAAGSDAAAALPQEPIVVSGAYVREPANGINAAAYFTIYNTTGVPDVLTTVQSGAGAQTSLHIESSGAMHNSAGLSIPARGSATLSPGKGHIMIEKLYGPLKPGQSVNFQLTFAKAGQLLLTAPVIAVTAPAPTAVAP
ncbi:MAG: periplasmic copper chaperone [Pseudonocardiales bacterium]|jgi:copper(I)-binding protein|nr:periplasmic copper chaperone [Pseudonocardiales bacterium]